mmetsp:Transcript_26192/g.38732  ORF Transcript_26192/g.38732 Transcript_26192/m.38732 type:complete len:693 (+) Transcript_26192:114-2192(+)|eukprot:CAMPEP_0194228948 /NCGR_PEP_ID=MMETSP0156-20130528/43636_1 /TAXON_ID=33649 /ORGANISM="Thalassionema nitzschioides, Strain L26-B" /LENGTH=692 /DNA_ID=CAMNT_0038961477 /DNA_START=111 /DNA_END=2189 /DNA_ORIENTATION=+
MPNSQLRKLIYQPGVLRSFSSRVAKTASPLLSKTVLSSDSKAFESSTRSFSSDERFAQLRSDGVLDEAGFTSFDTLHELRLASCKAYSEDELFGTFKQQEDGKGSYEWMTYKDFDALVGKTRTVLKNLGVEEFSKVGLISNNRWEWAAIASASYSLNATIVPMYEAQLPDDWRYIINDSGCNALFCATEDIFQQVRREVLPSTPSVKASVCFDAPLGEQHSFATLMDEADATTAVIEPTIDDLADLIYTSGTTGKPKGVELTHNNIVSNVQSAIRTMVDDPRDFLFKSDRTLAFLPWAHSYGQTCELWGCISQGASMGIGRGVPHILEDLANVKPTILFAVPTLYKRIYDGVHNMMESSSPVKKRMMKHALDLGRRRADAEAGLRSSLGVMENMQLKVLDKLVLDKIRDRFGGQLRHAFVAGAACPAEVLDFMDDLGIPVCEGYGLTETSPIIAINTPENRRNGFVGRPISGVKVYIMNEEEEVLPGEEGEICCVGDNVMRGYYKNQDATDEVISTAPDGVSRMFHTGDLGKMDDGYIKVTGRLKEQYKLENGKYVVPTPIEEAIGMSRFISQVVLYGANRPQNIALLVPDWNAIRTELGLEDDLPEEELANHKLVKSLIDAEIVANCWRLKKFEVPTKWAFVAPFTAANNMLTPKMSIRRHKVIETYGDIIAQLYGEEVVEDESGDAKASA